MQVVGRVRGVGPPVAVRGRRIDHRRGGEHGERTSGTTGEHQDRLAVGAQQLDIGGADAAHRPDLGRQVGMEDRHHSGQAALDLFDVDDVRLGDAVLRPAGRGVVDLDRDHRVVRDLAAGQRVARSGLRRRLRLRAWPWGSSWQCVGFGVVLGVVDGVGVGVGVLDAVLLGGADENAELLVTGVSAACGVELQPVSAIVMAAKPASPVSTVRRPKAVPFVRRQAERRRHPGPTVSAAGGSVRTPTRRWVPVSSGRVGPVVRSGDPVRRSGQEISTGSITRCVDSWATASPSRLGSSTG